MVSQIVTVAYYLLEELIGSHRGTYKPVVAVSDHKCYIYMHGGSKAEQLPAYNPDGRRGDAATCSESKDELGLVMRMQDMLDEIFEQERLVVALVAVLPSAAIPRRFAADKISLQPALAEMVRDPRSQDIIGI